MHHPTTVLLEPVSWAGVAGALRRIVAGAHWLKIAYAERRRAAREAAEFAQLDESTLRDLGLTRDEYLSYAAEARGLAPSTRLRIRDDRFRSATA
jgi:uncharacterized protein YjiS (DUF1127 family)